MVTKDTYKEIETTAAVFFDIDGTICRYGTSPTADLHKAFNTMRKNGHYTFLCTGRTLSEIPDDIYALGFDGIVGAMGAHVKLGEEKLLLEHIPEDLLIETVEAIFKHNLSAVLCGEENLITLKGRLNSTYAKLLDMRPTTYATSIEDLLQKGKMPAISCIDLFYPSREAVLPLLPYIEKHSELVEYDNQTGQTRLKGHNKATGIQTILNALNQGKLCTVGIGDSQNDIEMLQAVDIAVAMGDAPECVKLAANLVTKTVDENGVPHALALLKIA